MEIDMDTNVSLKIIACDCGSVYAVPHWVNRYNCPMCSHRRMEAYEAESRMTEQIIDARNRTIRSLRGALTKAKRRK